MKLQSYVLMWGLGDTEAFWLVETFDIRIRGLENEGEGNGWHGGLTLQQAAQMDFTW